MASLPSPTKVSGKHNLIYEAYYKQIDPKGTGAIEALTAAKFLKKSGLSDVVLSRIWDLSDPTGRGFLDKPGMFVALKLVALAQAGNDINMSNIFLESQNPPKVGDIPKIMPPKIQSVAPTTGNWNIKPIDKLKYEELFDSLKPVDGLIPGNKVRGVLMDSKLPLDVLSKIWDLADQDKDGSLDKHEFIVAMHLVYQALDKRAIPNALPAELQRPSQEASNDGDDGFVAVFPSDIGPPPPVPPLPAVLNKVAPIVPPLPRIPMQQPLISNADLLGDALCDLLPSTTSSAILPTATANNWVVTPADRIRFDGIFARSDLDHDGLVSGGEIKDIFIQSGIPQMCLAQIWALCDTHQSGKLTSEQFALAMWLVERKQKGFEPPIALEPDMIPPSLRNHLNEVSLIGDAILPVEQKPTYSNPELEMISKEIEELAKERRLLENDVTQKEADIRIKTGEVRSLQSELDTLVATLKQLENQKGEAQKRLNDLKAQQNDIGENVCTIQTDIDETRDKVTKIREQCQKQEETIREQEGELDSKRSELQKLKGEESALEREYSENQQNLDKLTKTLQETQLQICQIKALVTQLEESQRQMNDALAVCKTAIENNDPNSVSYYSLKLEPEFREAKKALIAKEDIADDPFGDKENKFSNGNAYNDGFGPTKFATAFDDNVPNSAGFAGFDDSFGGSNFSATKNDPFAATGAAKSTIADPFGDKKSSTAVTPDPNKDDFGSDPFAILHAPTSASQTLSPSQKSGPPPRPESPSPALPPKKAKQPPPRPAPPAKMQAPSKADAFGSSASAGDGFANFADFDNKNSGLSDFAEDPFKDYRYEDPFSIQDPFADNEDIFTSNQLTSHDCKVNNTNNNNNLIKIPNSTILINNNLLRTNHSNNVNNGNKNAVGDVEISDKLDYKTTANNNKKNQNNNHNNVNFNAKFGKDSEAKTNFTTFDEPVTSDTDFFAAFNDNFSKDRRNSNLEVVDAFGVGFNSNSTSEHGDGEVENNGFAGLRNNNLRPHTKHTSSPLTTDCVDNFDHKFATLNINNNNTATSSKLGFEDDDGFADFSAFDAISQTTKSNTLPYPGDGKVKTSPRKLNPIRGSDFEKLNANTVEAAAKPIPKFSVDYSKTDQFDDDLQVALQRSLVEQ